MGITIQTIGGVAGLAGIAIGSLTLIYRDILRQELLSFLTRRQSFIIILAIIVLTWIVAFAGIGAWLFTQESKAVPSTEVVNGIANSGKMELKGTVEIGGSSASTPSSSGDAEK